MHVTRNTLMGGESRGMHLLPAAFCLLFGPWARVEEDTALFLLQSISRIQKMVLSAWLYCVYPRCGWTEIQMH